jgi:hypothetical protein
VVADDLENAALARSEPVVVGWTIGERMELGHDRLGWPAGLAPLLSGTAVPSRLVIDSLGTVALTGDSFKQLFECFSVLSAGGCRKSLRRSIELLFEPLDSRWRASWATWLTQWTVGSVPSTVESARRESGWAQVGDGSRLHQISWPA